MRYGLSLMFAVLGLVATSGGNANAAPLHASSFTNADSIVEKVDYWRRYCRRYGCPPPAAVVPVPPPVDVPDVDAAPTVEAVPVVPLPPPRPLSCGEYRYWNGEACVDARYNSPYLGPK